MLFLNIRLKEIKIFRLPKKKKIHNEILFSSKKEYPVTFDNMDKPGGSNAT